MDLSALSQALRSAVTLRDRVVVVQLDPVALDTPAHLEGAAQGLALLRALDLRVIVILGARTGRRPAGAEQLVTAISRHGQRALTILPTGVISVHKLPMYVPVVDQALLIQLCSLRYIPILPLPVRDDAGEPVDMSANEVSAAVGKFLDASRVMVLHGDTKPDRLIAELLLGAQGSS